MEGREGGEGRGADWLVIPKDIVCTHVVVCERSCHVACVCACVSPAERGGALSEERREKRVRNARKGRDRVNKEELREEGKDSEERRMRGGE
jgi:hypothetical protein